MEIHTRLVGCEGQILECFIYLFSRGERPEVVHALIDVDGCSLLGEAQILAQGLLDELAGTGDNQLISQVEETLGQHLDEAADGPVGLVAPLLILVLCVSEGIAQGLHAKLGIVKGLVVAMADEVELTLHVFKASVNGSSREHQHLHVTALLAWLVLDEGLQQVDVT